MIPHVINNNGTIAMAFFHTPWTRVDVAAKTAAAVAAMPKECFFYRWAGDLLMGMRSDGKTINYVTRYR